MHRLILRFPPVEGEVEVRDLGMFTSREAAEEAAKLLDPVLQQYARFVPEDRAW